MITVEGSLLVRKIKSRNGPFCVADLVTDVGEFKIKDALLDQFDEGTYEGTFVVSEFFLAQYSAFGRAVTELRARLADLRIDGCADLPAQARRDPVEPDPVDEEIVPAKRRTERLQPIAAPSAAPLPEPRSKGRQRALNAADSYLALFGEEIFSKIRDRSPLKLDPTIGDRERYRKQCQSLREDHGYEWKALSQSWLPV